MNKIYFAGPLFCKAEKDYNVKIASILEEAGYEVFLPQRDGFEAFLLKDKTESEIIDLIFQKDTSEIYKSDILFMVLDGRVPDEGACVELGIAYALRKKCYGIKTDVRAMEVAMDLNPLIAGCFKKIFTGADSDKIIDDLKLYLQDNKL